MFAPQSLIMDPPFTKLDILSCRNLLIYLAPEMQKKLFPLFHYSLSPGGILFLAARKPSGRSPTSLSRSTTSCASSGGSLPRCDRSRLIFPRPLHRHCPTEVEMRPASKPQVSLQILADQLVLERFAPPAVLVNDKGNILYVSGRTGKYLEPAAGKANWNIFAMAREGLRYEISAASTKRSIRTRPWWFADSRSGRTAGNSSWIFPSSGSTEPESLKGLVMIVFTDAPAPLETKASGQCRARPEKAQPAAPRWKNWNANTIRPVSRRRPSAKKCRPRRRNSVPPTRSSNPPMRNFNPRTRS